MILSDINTPSDLNRFNSEVQDTIPQCDDILKLVYQLDPSDGGVIAYDIIHKLIKYHQSAILDGDFEEGAKQGWIEDKAKLELIADILGGISL